MKRFNRHLTIIVLILVLLIVPLGISGCSRGTNSVDYGIIEVPPSVLAPVIAYKSNRTEFDIDDVTLSFYYGSDRAGTIDITYPPIITYLYFANESYFVPRIDSLSGEPLIYNGYLSFKYASGIEMENMYGNIESDNRIHVSKILPDSFYRSQNVTVFGKDKNLSRRFLTMLWSDWSVLCKVKSVYEYDGILVPELCSEFTIPSSMFTSNNGYIMFCMTSYYTDDYCRPAYGTMFKAGTMLENTYITIYYKKSGNKVTLSDYYIGE